MDALYRGSVRIRRLKEPAAAAAWFRQILVNLWRDRLKRSQRRDLSLDDVPEPAAWGGSSPAERLEALETREAVERAVRMLPPGQRAVLALRIDEDLSVSEIARVLATTPERVKANLWHARRRLRRLLADRLAERSSAEEEGAR